MHVRVAHFTLAPGKRTEAVAVADTVGRFIRSQPGCARFEFCIDDETGECAFVVQWHSKHEAEAALVATKPVLSSELTKAGGTVGNIHLFELYETN